ncbi:uncharacterized protein RSE6_08193 [Rhynchosporium secalis]|uniref:SET domain-containing protein n=1 Tax=Rhynchosporium secalis TaxID=38038 RepID=A0A1E1MET9_RHYSE|nr:uncharacterized protein RSE6_08193 [Rhynchosporium secalis]
MVASMNDPSTRIQALVSWAQGHGTSLHPQVEIYHDSITGMSFRALQDILPGSKLVDCSFRTTLSYLNAIEASPVFLSHSPPFPPHFIDALKIDDPNVIGHFFLIQQYLLGPDSFWWDYIRLLPQPDSPEAIGLPVWWPDSDQAFLAGTNAEPPIKKRKSLWEEEWRQGLSLLREGFSDSERYTYHMYQWAASIFGSRSFRASLTIPSEYISVAAHDDLSHLNMAHIDKDRFSVLLPVMDIGNHDGQNRVDWSQYAAEGTFSLSNSGLISRGSQIYNFYGDKSNSELLVAYGFILPDLSRDVVNLRLTPSPEAVLLRRSQNSYKRDPKQLEREFMFNVGIPEPRSHQGLSEPNMLSPGLVDTMSCMVANSRERRYLLSNPTYSVENDPAAFRGAMSRNLILVLRLIHEKLQYEVSRIEQSDAELGEPQNQNQRIALEYRSRQIQVLKTAIPPISSSLLSALNDSSELQHPTKNVNYIEQDRVPKEGFAEFLSLERAFDWLHLYFPEISLQVSQLISEDQEEPLPLDWAVLIEDWDHTYWTVWIYLVWMLWLQNTSDFEDRHAKMTAWIGHMNLLYDEALSLDSQSSRLYADSTEKETIDSMVQDIAQISSLKSVSASHPGLIKRLRNFASFVATEEVIPASYQMRNGSQSGEMLEQKLLCIWNSGGAQHVQHSGLWTEFLFI